MHNHPLAKKRFAEWKELGSIYPVYAETFEWSTTCINHNCELHNLLNDAKHLQRFIATKTHMQDISLLEKANVTIRHGDHNDPADIAFYLDRIDEATRR